MTYEKNTQNLKKVILATIDICNLVAYSIQITDNKQMIVADR